MIGKYDYKFYKKGSIVPKEVCFAKSKRRENFIFGEDCWLIKYEGRKELYFLNAHDFSIIERKVTKQGCLFKNCDFINLNKKKAKATFLLKTQAVHNDIEVVS